MDTFSECEKAGVCQPARVCASQSGLAQCSSHQLTNTYSALRGHYVAVNREVGRNARVPRQHQLHSNHRRPASASTRNSNLPTAAGADLRSEPWRGRGMEGGLLSGILLQEGGRVPHDDDMSKTVNDRSRGTDQPLRPGGSMSPAKRLLHGEDNEGNGPHGGLGSFGGGGGGSGGGGGGDVDCGGVRVRGIGIQLRGAV